MECIDKYVWYQEGPGVRKQQYTLDGIKLLNVANLVDGKIDLSTSHRYISEDEATTKYKHFLVDEGDLIIASSGIQVNYFDKKMGFAKKEHLPLCMNTSTIRFKVLDSKITNINYFMWFLKSDIFKDQLRKLITGSAQLNFGPSHLKKIKINMPSLKEQQDIVKELEKVQEVIDMKSKQNQDLDKLIKSQFVELFGDPILNNKNWKTDELNNVAPSKPYKGELDNKVWLLNLDMVESQSGRIIDYVYEDIENVGNSTCRFSEKNILYSKLRPYLNKVVIPDKKGIATSELIPLLPKENILERYFLAYLLRSEEFVKYISEKVAGAKMPRVSMDIFRSFKVILPPIELQNQFAEFVKLIDKQKFEIQKSLEEMKKLQESLMNKYFRE